jgi:hypothetical protein
VRSEGRYRLDRDVVSVDYWRLSQGSGLEAVARYQGDLGEGITSLWVDVPQQELRSRITGEAGNLIRNSACESLSAAVAVLEMIRSTDPYNEKMCRGLTSSRQGWLY